MHLRPHLHLPPRLHPSLPFLNLRLSRPSLTTPLTPSPSPPHPSTSTSKPTLLFSLRRPFHTTPPTPAGSPFFALGALSNSRESQWFKKASGLGAVEHSTNLELIRSSEVVPFLRGRDGVPSLGAGRRRIVVRGGALAAAVAASGGAPVVAKVSVRDAKALAVGREVLKRNTRTVARLKSLLSREKRVHAREKEKLAGENQKLKRENKGASLGVVVAVGVATAVVAWKSWPEARRPRVAFKSPVESGVTQQGDGMTSSFDVGRSLDPVEVVRAMARADEEDDRSYSLSLPHQIGQVVEHDAVALFVPSAGLEVGQPEVVAVQPVGEKRAWYSWFWDH